MREYLVLMETMAPKREIEVLHRCIDSAEALEKLVLSSDKFEGLIVEGKCRVLMTTYKK